MDMSNQFFSFDCIFNIDYLFDNKQEAKTLHILEQTRQKKKIMQNINENDRQMNIHLTNKDK
jgi:hypothetical protein